jgi:hypothetical protein
MEHIAAAIVFAAIVWGLSDMKAPAVNDLFSFTIMLIILFALCSAYLKAVY